jgi:mono/diheme cytochrome c family protein
VALRFVVTAEASKEAKSVIHDLHEAYEADLPDDAAARIDEVLDRLTLVLTVSLKDGREYVSKQQRIHNYRSPRSWDLNQIVRNGPTVAYITVPIPRSVVSQVASVEGKIEVQAEPVAQPQRAAKRSSVSDDLNRELEEELRKIKQFQPAAKLDIPAVMTPKTTLKENGDDDTASDELIQGSGNARIGKSIFNGKGVCFNCHGPSGVIGRIPANIAAVISQFNPKPSNFKNPQSLRLTTDKQRFRAIKYGIRETGMVAMTHISDEEIIHVLAYLKTLREEATNKPDAQ